MLHLLILNKDSFFEFYKVILGAFQMSSRGNWKAQISNLTYRIVPLKGGYSLGAFAIFTPVSDLLQDLSLTRW